MVAIFLGSVDVDEHALVFSVYFKGILMMRMDDALGALIRRRSE
jgi:hypothetical protein